MPHKCSFFFSSSTPDTHVMVKEWAAYKGKSPHTPELVEALPFREWTCPNLKKLWLGKAVEDKNRRMRAFLACMRSDTPAMLNPANVPTPLLVLCCVLRWADGCSSTHRYTVCRCLGGERPVWSEMKGSEDLLNSADQFLVFCNTVNLLCFASGLCYIGQE